MIILSTVDKEIKIKYRSNKKTLEGPLQQFPIHKHIYNNYFISITKKVAVPRHRRKDKNL